MQKKLSKTAFPIPNEKNLSFNTKPKMPDLSIDSPDRGENESIHASKSQIIQIKLQRTTNAICHHFNPFDDTYEKSPFTVIPVKMKYEESPNCNAKNMHWVRRTAKCDVKHNKAAASLKKEDEHKVSFQEEKRIKLMKSQLFTSTRHKKSFRLQTYC